MFVRAVLVLGFLGGCGSKESAPPAPTPQAPTPQAPTPQAPTPQAPTGPTVTSSVEVFSPGSSLHLSTIGFSISAPTGTKPTPSGFTLPAGPAVYVTPRESYIDPAYTYPGHEKPVSERLLVSRDCTQMRVDFDRRPWNGKSALASPPEGFAVCVGPGLGEPSCHFVDGHVANAQADCGGGYICLTSEQALDVLAVCTTLRRTGMDAAAPPTRTR